MRRRKRVVLPQGNDPPREGEQLLVGVVPVEPRHLVVLAVGVVVAALRAAELVAGEQHRHALREEQRREQVSLLAFAQGLQLRVFVGPSTPQFQLRLLSEPSRLSSRLASLRLRS